uniref:Uncharacterized protein n=1 Tax=Microcebus murinus TaxID=30608 RepID=A0A8C5YB30_MICMU
MNEPKNVKIQKTVKLDGQDDSKVTAIALAIVKDVIDAAVKFVEDADNPIKNIKWITHGEFTAERGRKQIEQFVLDAPIDVSYLVHRPGMIRFREKWPRDIIDAKNILIESIKLSLNIV